LRIAVVGAGVAGAYLLNRIPDEHEVECFEMRPEEKWYTVNGKRDGYTRDEQGG